MPEDPRKAAEDADDALFGGDDDDDEEDEDVDMTDVDTAPLPPASGPVDPLPLPTRILTPSPYPHHIRGATSARFRNALSRVTTHPTSDAEAWAALLTEVQTCWRQLKPTLDKQPSTTETQAKLDFLVSCYGALLYYFPYSTEHSLQLGQILFEASAQEGANNSCEGQLETLLRTVLHAQTGADFGPLPTVVVGKAQTEEEKQAQLLSFLTPPPAAEAPEASQDPLRKVLGGMGTWAIPLWQLYLQKVHRDLKRHALSLPPDTRAQWIQDQTVASYELVLERAGFGYNNHWIWKDYVNYVRGWTTGEEEQTTQLRSIFQRLVQMPMNGLDALWQDYEAFERSNSEEALLTDYAPKYQQARTIYLERARVYNYTGDLQLGRLATPPVTRRMESDQTAGDTGGDVDDANKEKPLEEYYNNLQEEHKLVQAWKKRVSYERTNPERLDPVQQLPRRMRNAHLQMISVLTRHPEAWHMWATYEYQHSMENPVQACAVLQLALQHIPDCTLLAHTQAQWLEHSSQCGNNGGKLAMQVLETFGRRSPNTLAFCLYQQLVRRHRGPQAARAVFRKARTVLTGEPQRPFHPSSSPVPKEGDDSKEETGAGEDGGEENKDVHRRGMVVNRQEVVSGRQPADATKAEEILTSGDDATGKDKKQDAAAVAAGPITWHLYASHATMEHRINHFPQVAARIYELGLRNHPHFLTQPPFVLRYAQLLLELNDTNNLRALLTRAVAAATEDEGNTTTVKASVAAVLWDMTLQFETILSGADPMANQLLQDVERKRHMALMGPDLEDVATGGLLLESANSATIGAQKSTIAEQLIRNDGYDISSTVVSGMARSASVLEVMGVWGSNIMANEISMKRISQSNKSGMEFLEEEENPGERSGGASDASYQRRLLYQRLYESGMLLGGAGGGMGVSAVGGGAGAGNKILAARDRMATTAGVGAGPTAAVNMAIQSQPEWIRPLLLLLPASKMRLLTRPPPHLVEMTLQQLRQCSLPAERARISGQKRSAPGGD